MGSGKKAVLFASIVAVIAALPASAFAECAPRSLRSSRPSVVWRSSGANEVQVSGSFAYLVSPSRLRKLDALSGRVIWIYRFKESHDYFSIPDVVVTGSRVAVVVDDRFVAFLDEHTGRETGRTDTGAPILSLTGNPLLAVTRAERFDKSRPTEFVELSQTGAILRRRASTPLEDQFIRVGDRLVVQTVPISSQGPRMLSVLAVDTLRPIWSGEGRTFALQMVDERLLVGDVFWSAGATALDPRSGEESHVPMRAPAPVGGSGEFDLQRVEVGHQGAIVRGDWIPSYYTCQALRRNDSVTGAPRWRVDLPLGVTATLRDGDRLYLAGGRDASHQYVVALNWETGEVEKTWSGVPLFHELRKAGDLVIGYELGGKLWAMRLFR